MEEGDIKIIQKTPRNFSIQIDYLRSPPDRSAAEATRGYAEQYMEHEPVAAERPKLEDYKEKFYRLPKIYSPQR